MEYSPIFESIMHKLRALPKSEYNTPHNRRLFVLAQFHAPPELNRMFEEECRERGLIPTVTCCDADGNGLITVEELAAFHGQSVDETLQTIAELKTVLPDGTLDEYTREAFAIN
jgi:hypothetical protein